MGRRLNYQNPRGLQGSRLTQNEWTNPVVKPYSENLKNDIQYNPSTRTLTNHWINEVIGPQSHWYGRKVLIVDNCIVDEQTNRSITPIPDYLEINRVSRIIRRINQLIDRR